MTTLTTNNHKLLIVEVPEDAKDIEVINGNTLSDLWYNLNNVDDAIALHPNKYSLLGTITSGKVDFDCEGLVDKIPHHHIGNVYRNYLFESDDAYLFDFAHQSFISLLQSKGIEYKKCVVLRIN